MALVACPFCREMFERTETEYCPVCGLRLTAFEKLPLSHDAALVDGEAPTMPEQEVLPWLYWQRGRMPLAALGVLGVATFFLPWVHMTLPYEAQISGFDLSQRMGWSWATLAAWMVLVPTVLSRRTIMHMRRARVAVAFLAAVPAMTAIVLWLKPPQGRLFTVHFDYGYAFWLSLVLSVVCTVMALRFGGRIDNISVKRGSSVGQSLH